MVVKLCTKNCLICIKGSILWHVNGISIKDGAAVLTQNQEAWIPAFALSALTVELPGMPALAVAADAARRTHAVPLAWTSSVSRRRLCGLT